MHVIFGTGPLGQAVASELVARGESVRLVNRSGHLSAKLAGVEVVAGDLTEVDSARRAVNGATVVYHCAAGPYTNWQGTLHRLMEGAIDAAASAGASLVYGDNLYTYMPSSDPLTEETPERPRTRKGKVRKTVADLLRKAHEDGRVRAAIGRGSDFYGPGVLASAVGSEVFGRLQQGKTPRVLGNPDQLHSFTYIEDFGRGLAVLASHPEALGQTWHIPNAPALSTREFAARASKAMGKVTKVQTTPAWMIRALGLFNPMMREVAEMLYEWEQPFVVDHQKFEKAFGKAFGAPTPIDRGILETARSFG